MLFESTLKYCLQSHSVLYLQKIQLKSKKKRRLCSNTQGPVRLSVVVTCMLAFSREKPLEKGWVLLSVQQFRAEWSWRDVCSPTLQTWVCSAALHVKFNFQSEQSTLFFINEYVRCSNDLYLSVSSFKCEKNKQYSLGSANSHFVCKLMRCDLNILGKPECVYKGKGEKSFYVVIFRSKLV